ncbi:MFS transporter [Roseibium sediminicola]|uniref:MFS transporter n=1 Tax=Roseibium sediminicola TaxID=2933272 RepID=A0ABT0GRL5_9HYPH|nr:MFS transporter [Roseibium sp. CAU 1639]MCK7612084.1 MFS transporter [Roseibium sp. CAU 1639]
MTSHAIPSERPLWLESAAIALLMTATLKIMANATISPALPGLAASFPEDPNAAYLTRFLVAAPSLSVVLVAPFAGMAADRFGRVPLLLAGVLLFAISGSAGAYLPDLQAILASRLLLGVAVALTMTAQVALVGDLFAGARRNAFMGLQTAAINFSGFLYIGLAGWLAGLSPRLPFLVYALPVLLVPLLLPFLHGPRQQEAAGARNDLGPADASPAAWLLPAFLVAVPTMVTVMMFFLMPSQLPFYLEANGFDGASGTAFGLGALTLTGGCVAMVFKRISGSLGLSATFGLGFLLMGAGLAVLAIGALWIFILGGAALVGAGYALVQPAFLTLALQVAPEHRRGSVSGMITTAMFLGQVVSPLTLTPFIQALGFASVFLGAALVFALFALGALTSLVLRPHRPEHSG